MRKSFIAAGLACGLAASLAVAAVFDGHTLSEVLGTDGTTITMAAGKTSLDALDCTETVVFCKRDESVSPAGLTGTIDYRARRDFAEHYIHRVKFEVRAPGSSSWTVLRDVTQPDSRIVNPPVGDYNTYSDTFSTADMDRGYYLKVTVWNAPSCTSPIVHANAYEEP